MKLDALMVRGVLAFDNAVTLDLTTLPPGSIVAVTGPNGSGKTTLMETPIGATYRTFPFREKAVLDYALSRESCLEAVWHVDTHTYRVRLNLDGVRRLSEGIIEEDGHPLNDGKVTTLDAQVARLFPPLPVVLASAFAAQNRRGSFISLDRKGRKDLFASLLGLDWFETMATRARAAAAAAAQRRDLEVARRDEIAKLAGPDVEAALADRANRLQVETGQLDIRQREIQAALDAIVRDREACQEAAARYASALTSRDRLQVEIAAQTKTRARVDDQRVQLESDAEAERKRIADQLLTTEHVLNNEEAVASKTCADAIAAAEKAAARTRSDLDARIANNRRLLADADAIRRASRDLESAEEQLAVRRACIQEGERTLETLRTTRESRQAAVTRLEQLARDLARATTEASLLDSVPCGGGEPYASCQFLARAREGAAARPALEAEVATLELARAVLAHVAADRDALSATLAASRKDVASLEKETADLKARTKHLSEIDLAEVRIADYEQQLPQIAATLVDRRAEAEAQRDRTLAAIDERRAAAHLDADRARTELKARVARRDEALAGERAGLDDTIAVNRAALADAETALAETAEAHTRLQTLDGEQAAQQRTWATTEGDRGRLEAERGALERDWTALRDRRRELDETGQRLAVLDRDLVEWQALARIFHRDGLPTLLIGAAGPEVADLTNDLAQASFGSRFVVELVTQEAKVSGKGLKETFELKILDSERGGDARDLSDLSGGEQVIIDECLKAALALYAKRHHAQPIETCWRDETTGPLDDENRARYLPMLRRLQQLGGFHALLFVTHDAEVAAQADAQVQVGGGTARLAFPPYEQTEAA